MHQKKLEKEIKEEEESFVVYSKPTNLRIQIPDTQIQSHYESPHKRSIMTTQTLSHSPTLSSLKLDKARHQQTLVHNTSCSTSSSSSQTFLCFSFSRNSSAQKLVQNLYRLCLLRFHLRFLIIFCLPSFYFFFFTNPHRFLMLNSLFLLAFVITLLLISINLALPRFPSLRLLLPRSLSIKLASSSSSASSSKGHIQPVVWSIGSKQKPGKNPNSGSWVKVYSNGDVYEGEFHKGKCSGSGVYYYYKKGRYEGDWVDGKYDGYGVETWARGSRYRGQYRQGLRHGIGVYRFYTGDVYAGEWSNGQCHGCGVHTCEDGSMYVGEFKWGVKHGLGHYHFRNGDTYSGEYFADKMHGFGVYQFGNGHRYEGAWHEGSRQGLGMYTFRSGEMQSGHWHNGVLDIPSTQISHPGSPRSVSHPRVLNAVQEAQRAATKAYEVARVEERVNKAISAANKAANAARVAAVKAVQNKMRLEGDDDLATTIV